MDRERLQIVKPQGAVAAIDEQKNLVVLVERKRNGVNGRFEKRGEIRDQNSDAVGKIDFPQAVSECNGALMPVVRQVRRKRGRNAAVRARVVRGPRALFRKRCYGKGNYLAFRDVVAGKPHARPVEIAEEDLCARTIRQDG